MSNKQQTYLEGSKFGQLPPKLIIIFSISFIIFLLIQSAIYSAIEDWDFIDALYFSIISISTVGYGDITPTNTIGKAMNIIFILISFCGLFTFFRVIVGYLVDHQIALIIKRIKARRKQDEERQNALTSSQYLSFKKPANLEEEAEVAQDAIEREEDEAINKGYNVRWIVHLIAYLLWLIVWTLYYAYAQSEDLSLFNALYFGIVTSTTIGYGEYSPQSTNGKIFCLCLTMFGTLFLTILAGSVSQGLLALIRSMTMKKQKQPKDEVYRKTLERLLTVPKAGIGKLDKCDFICEMLVSGNECKKHLVEKLYAEFDKLDVNGDGVLDEKDFEIYKQQTLMIEDGKMIAGGNLEMQLLGTIVNGTAEKSEDESVDIEAETP